MTPNVPRCKTCDWWRNRLDNGCSWTEICQQENYETGEKRGKPFEVRLCLNPKLLPYANTFDPEGAAVRDDEHGRSTTLSTSEGFGCVHHSQIVSS